MDDLNGELPLATEPLPEGFKPEGQTIDDVAPEAPEEVVVEEQAAPEQEIEEIEEPDGEEEVVEENPNSGKTRIRQQSETIRKQREYIQTLQNQLGNISGEDIFDDEPPSNLFDPEIAPGQEITADRYKQDVAQTANALVTLRMKQAQNATRIKSEVIEAISEHPELNDKSDSFDEDLSDTVTEAVKVFVTNNPTGDVKGYINKMMKPYKRSVEKAVSKQTETIAKQVSQAAMRPTQVKETSTKKFEELSLEEMAAKLGKVYS